MESNPGPEIEQMLKDTMLQLKELKEADTKRDATLSEVNAKLSKLDEVLKISKENEEKIQKLEGTLLRLEKALTGQDRRLNNYENRSRRNNVVVFGIPEEPKETRQDLEDKVLRKVFGETLGVSVRSVERIHRIGRLQKDRHRPVILRLYDYNEKMELFRNCPKLKGSEVSISHDYSQAT
ncbi:hypothetical protein HPB51_006063 [Rhipicephalus microplus]|uniref:Uncharacterized protein n=1 Tax=Rhipicephalus microplus TaxID=6941 RepID=A0A9J6EGD4_RHIMP|nr:hypothetical protein HPB51_006063 [Rhipicephalus microplus]